MNTTERRERLITTLRERDALHDDRVATAFRAVPREVFLPGIDLDVVYRDEAIVTKKQDGVGVSSSSQPAIMAIMLEQLDVRPGMRVLEIGAGTGYNAALLRELVGTDGQVVTIDIDDEVAGWARQRLDNAGYEDVEVWTADGADGWGSHAPYDRIELTVGVADISPAWVEQLNEGGVLVLPLQIHAAQAVIAFEKRGEQLISRSVQPGGFMPVRGKLAGRMHQLEVMPGVGVATADAGLPLDQLGALLSETPKRQAWPGSLWDGFHFIGGLLGLPMIAIWTDRPDLGFHRAGFGIFNPSNSNPGLAIVAEPAPGQPAELSQYGDVAAAETLLGGYREWESIGKPAISQLRIAASPLSGHVTAEGEWEIATQRWRLAVRTS